jgi:hypothetical protein
VLMIFTRRGRCAGLTALLATALPLAGCSSLTNQASDTFMTSGGHGGASAPNATGNNGSQSLAFDPSTLIKVPVLGQATATVRVTPAQSQTVTFALIGNSLDASLTAAQATSDAGGLASVALTASSLPTSFSIRASLDRSSAAEVQVSVVDAPTSSIDVAAQYAGTRQVEQYTIVIYPNADCSSSNLNQTAVDRIQVVTTTLPKRIDGISLTRPLAVVVNGDKSVYGCSAVRGVAGQSSLSVQVLLEDLPLYVYETTLKLSMSTSDGLPALKDNVSAIIPTFVAAFTTGDHDLTDLLANMQAAATGSLQQEFTNLRSASNWDALVVDTYASIGGNDLLRRQLRTWLNQGVELLSTQPTLDVELALGPSDYSPPQLALVRFAGVDVGSNVLMQNSALALNPEANDRLSWSSTLSFSRATLLDILAFASASTDLPGMDGIPAQLDSKLDCNAFGSNLDQHAVWPNANSRVCTAACLATLCRSGLTSMYLRAKAAVFGVPTTLLVNASGKVVVDSRARPTAMTGTWIGALSTEATPVTLSGTYESH